MGKEEGAPTLTKAWTELENIVLSETGQVVKDKYRMISLISGTNQQSKQASKIQPQALK